MKPIRDPFGNTFHTLKEFEEHYAVQPHEYRINRKASWKNDYIAFRKNVVFDHKGYRYVSVEEMLTVYGITQEQYEIAKEKRYSTRETLEQKVATIEELVERTSSKEEVEYFLNHNFETIAKKHNVSRRAVYSRLRKGMCLADALCNEDEPLELSDYNNKTLHDAKNDVDKANSAKFKNETKAIVSKKVTDEFGNVFESTKAFETYYGISAKDYRLKSRAYYVVDYAIFKKGVIFDHKGKKFDSEEEMCNHWDVEYSVYFQMHNQSNVLTRYSVREILEKHVESSKELLSRVGEYSFTITEISNMYGISRRKIMDDMRKGMNLHDIIAKKDEEVTMKEITDVKATIKVKMSEECMIAATSKKVKEIVNDVFITKEKLEQEECAHIEGAYNTLYEAIESVLTLTVKNVIVDEHLQIVESAHVPERPETYNKAWVVIEDGEEKIWSKKLFKQYCEEINNEWC